MQTRLIIPPVYEVYRGYIVFVFSVTMFVYVGLCVFFFFVKDFSGTTESRILKFGTNVGYNLLYCVRENQPPPLIIPIICPFFFLSNKNICHRFLGFYESQSLQILYTP